MDSQIDFDAQITDFPHPAANGGAKATLANLRHLFKHYGIVCEYDEILKKQSVFIKAYSATSNDLSESSTYAQIKSLLSLNNLPLSCIDLIPALLEQNRSNPIKNFILSQAWDGVNRLQQLCNSLHVAEVDIAYRDLAVTTWLVQCVAACDSGQSSPLNAVAKFELVLVLQGEQGLGKTTWFRSLLPTSLADYIIDGAHLDPADKDSVKKCISAWICELGEVDATFRKADIARLKSFLSSTHDQIRLPYDRVPSTFKRRTSFGASVNPSQFLTDSTGSRRFLPIAVIECERHKIDMQQLWAQIWTLYVGGSQWWCSAQLDYLLETHHSKHAEINPIAELITDNFNVYEPVKKFDVALKFRHLSITAILLECGVKSPTKDNIRQAKIFLESKGFSFVQRDGIRGYWITNDKAVDSSEEDKALGESHDW